MPKRVRSQKQARRRRADALRAAGKTWGEVAEVFRDEYEVNARVALRIARGWSQGDTADRWNERWPDDPKTFKNVSYWERWPAETGYTPSLDVLSKLAQLYDCHVAELLADGMDRRESDPVYRARRDLQRLPVMISPSGECATDSSVKTSKSAHPVLDEFIARVSQADVQDLARETALWSAQLDPSVDRRTLLLKLGFALTVAAASDDQATSISPAPKGGTTDLSGIWRSEYAYYSTGRACDFTSVHYVVVRQQNDALSIESIPQSSGSVATMQLSVQGLVATGTWEERTSPTGYYKGASYQGAVQLLLAPSGTRMTGRWIGFGKNFQINNGEWELSLETRSLSQRSRALFEAKL